MGVRKNSVNESLFEATVDYFKYKKSEANANLRVLLGRATGIGEHSDIVAETRKWVEQLAAAQDCLETLQHLEEE